MDSEINTSGGTYVGESVTSGGDFVGRDKIIIQVDTINGKMAEVLDKLAEKTGISQTYFEQFIEPIWIAFNIVHEDYKTSFRTYIEKLSQRDVNIDELIRQIRQDSIFSEHLRNQLTGQAGNLPIAGGSKTEQQALFFLNEIRSYLFTCRTFSDKTGLIHPVTEDSPLIGGMNMMDTGNIPRSTAIRYLEYNRDLHFHSYKSVKGMIIGIIQKVQNFWKKSPDDSNLIHIFEQMFHELQSSYNKAAKAYYASRSSLIKS